MRNFTLESLGIPEPVAHLVAEARGFRYYINSNKTLDEAYRQANLYKERYQGMPVSFYIVERNSSMSLNGDAVDLETEIFN